LEEDGCGPVLDYRYKEKKRTRIRMRTTRIRITTWKDNNLENAKNWGTLIATKNGR